MKSETKKHAMQGLVSEALKKPYSLMRTIMSLIQLVFQAVISFLTSVEDSLLQV